jgi:hypothetical protein
VAQWGPPGGRSEGRRSEAVGLSCVCLSRMLGESGAWAAVQGPTQV